MTGKDGPKGHNGPKRLSKSWLVEDGSDGSGFLLTRLLAGIWKGNAHGMCGKNY